MDIKRKAKSKLTKRIRAAIIILLSLAIVGGVTLALAKLKPAAPTLDRSTAVIDTVKRGPMVREVRGSGTLVPQVVRWVPAPSDGRVEKILLQPGVEVRADTIIVELSNPEMEQQAVDSEFQVKAAIADEENLRVRLESERMTQESALASINAEYSQGKLQLDTDETLAKQGLVADLLLKLSRVRVEDLANRLKIEKERLAIRDKSTKAQINAQESRVQQLQALGKLKRDQVDALKVRAGTNGVLQQISVQVGQQVAVDTRNGIIQGQVSRIDPAAREGTFTVDAEFSGPLPTSARADLSVDGTIELERLGNVLNVSRPAFGQGQQTLGLFKLTADGQEAVRTPVTLGRSSVNTIEIISGLNEGDQVILSDTSAMDSYSRIRVR